MLSLFNFPLIFYILYNNQEEYENCYIGLSRLLFRRLIKVKKKKKGTLMLRVVKGL